MSNLLGNNLEGYVLKQIRTRQILHGSGVDSLRNSKKIKALAASTSFLRLASAVEVDEEKLKAMGLDIESNVGDGLARNNILFAGTSKLNKTTTTEVDDSDPDVTITNYDVPNFSNESRSGFSPDGKGSYELSRDYGRVPMAGITDAKIKTLTRGSIKKSTISIKAYSREQFEILDILYMRLGMTVCLEWGHSLYPEFGVKENDYLDDTSSETPNSPSGGDIELTPIRTTYITDSDNGFFSPSSIDQFSNLEQIQTFRHKFQGNYDAMLGRVSNFKWSYNIDGTYDISLTVISMGDVIESLKTNLSVDLETENFLKEAIKQLPSSGPNDELSTSAKDVNILTSFFWVWKFLNRGFNTGEGSSYTKDEIVNWFEDGWNYRTTGLENLNGATKYWIGNYMLTGLPGTEPGEAEVVTHKVQFYSIIATGEEDIIWDDGTYYYPGYSKYKNGGKGGKRGGPIIIDGNLFKSYGMSESGGSYTTKFEGGDQGENSRATSNTSNQPVWMKELGVPMHNFTEWIRWTDNQDNWEGDDLFGSHKLTYTVETTRSKIPTSLQNLKRTDGVMLNNSLGNPASTMLSNRKAAEQNEEAGNPSDGPHYFIRFKAFLDFLKETVLPRVDLGFPPEQHNKNESIMRIDTDIDTNIMYSLPNHLSLDPRICIVRNDNFRSQQNKTWKYYTDGNGNGGLEIFSPVEGIQIGEETFQNTAYIMNIYLNFDFCMGAIRDSADEKGNVNLYQLLSTLTNGINLALGGINNLEPVIDETSNSIKIIESTQIPGYVNKDSFKIDLNVVGYTPEGQITSTYPTSTTSTSTFIRKVNIDTTISPDLASMITIGATQTGYVKGTDATAFSKWNKGLKDRFKEDYLPGSSDSLDQPITGSNGEEVDLSEALNNYFVKYLSTNSQIQGSTYGMAQKNLGYIENWDSEIIDRNVSIVSEFYRYLIATRTKRSQGNGVCGGTLGFIPFKMGFTMDGMSGWKIYNSVNINTSFLPKIYGETLNFIVTAVDHDIKVHDWTTEVQVQVVPKSTQEHNTILNLEYEYGIAKAADLTTATDIVAIYATKEEQSNPGAPNNDPIGEKSTTLGTSPSTDTLNKDALKTDESIESVIKAGLDIIDNL